MSSILVIDDDAAVRETIRVLLSAHGHDVVTVADGNAGIEAAKNPCFDLAIIDLFMPGMDGLKVMEAIHQSHPALPLIAMSGFMFGGRCLEMPNFETMASEVGAAAALYKPFRAGDLMRAVSKAIAIPRSSCEAEIRLPR